LYLVPQVTRRRFIADEVESDRAALTGAHAAHLSRVLRARVGQQFDLSLGDQVRRAKIVSITDDRVEFELGEPIRVEAVRSITLALAVFKFDRFEWAIEKCTELGASRIVPIIARRTDPHLAHGAGKRAERWRRIARQASEQSRRFSAPEIAEPVKLRDYLSGEVSTTRIVLAESEAKIQLRDLCRGDGEIALAIGPEGGWAAEELKAFADAGWHSSSLGKRILRAETAAIAALSVIEALTE
jgi:16S rRNA (uracil1498-N3)-methyltransferase